MKAKPFLVGLSAGIIGGIVAMIFTTPQPGKQVRSNIATNTKLAKNNITDLREQANVVKQSVITLKNEAKNNIFKSFIFC